jgi:hypothetical protein
VITISEGSLNMPSLKPLPSDDATAANWVVLGLGGPATGMTRISIAGKWAGSR